jgi:hypothetical protein
MATHNRANPDERIEQLISILCSLIDGEGAIEPLVAFGNCAVPHLLSFLIDEPPHTIPQPRCWAVQILGKIGAYAALQNYLRSYTRPKHGWVMLAEDTVRSAAAYELSRAKSEENFQILLNATRQRASQGLVRALADYERNESIPLMFDLLEDDLCREEARSALLRVPGKAGAYAILLLRGHSHLDFEGPMAVRRRRGVFKLLNELGIERDHWRELEVFLADDDADCAIETARIGLSIADEVQGAEIILNLLYASSRMSWLQELETMKMLDAHPELARQICSRIASRQATTPYGTELRAPSWRILRHVLGNDA